MIVAALELTLVTTDGALDTGVELSQIAAMIVGSEFLRAVATAVAISSEREEEVSAETTTDAADNEGEEVQAVETKPASKLLLVERGRTITDSHRIRSLYSNRNNTQTTTEILESPGAPTH